MAKIGSLTADLTLESAAFIRDLRKAAQETANNTDRMARQMRGLQSSAQSVGRSFQDLRRVLGAYVGIQIVRNFLDTADAAKQLTGQLKLVTSGADDLRETQQKLFELAQRTRGSLEGTVELYTRLSRGTRELGTSQDDLLKVTEAVNQAIVISGSSASSAQAALIQLSQGLASGTLRGEELNSVMEQTPRLAQAIAEGMGITIGQLREFGKQGKITGEAVVKSLLNQAETINQEYGQMGRTVSQAFTQLRNEWIRVVGTADEATGATSEFTKAIDDVRAAIASKEFINGLATVIKGFAALAQNMDLVAIAGGAIIGGRLGSALLGRLGAIAGAVAGGTEAWLAYKRAIEGAAKAQQEFEEAAAGSGGQGNQAAPPGVPTPDARAALVEAGGEMEEFWNATVKATQAGRDLQNAFREGASIFDATRTPLEAYRLELERLTEILQQGAIDADTFGRAQVMAAASAVQPWLQVASTIGGALGTLFEDNKAVAIAQAIINTAQGITAALAQYPPPLSFVMAAAQAAAGAAQIAAIKSTTPGSGGTVNKPSASGGSGRVASSRETTGAVQNTLTVNIEGEGFLSRKQLENVMEQIMDAQRDGAQIVLGST